MSNIYPYHSHIPLCTTVVQRLWSFIWIVHPLGNANQKTALENKIKPWILLICLSIFLTFFTWYGEKGCGCHCGLYSIQSKELYYHKTHIHTLIYKLRIWQRGILQHTLRVPQGFKLQLVFTPLLFYSTPVVIVRHTYTTIYRIFFMLDWLHLTNRSLTRVVRSNIDNALSYTYRIYSFFTCEWWQSRRSFNNMYSNLSSLLSRLNYFQKGYSNYRMVK